MYLYYACPTQPQYIGKSFINVLVKGKQPLSEGTTTKRIISIDKFV